MSKDSQINVRITEELHKRLREEDINVSSIVRKSLEESVCKDNVKKSYVNLNMDSIDLLVSRIVEELKMR